MADADSASGAAAGAGAVGDSGATPAAVHGDGAADGEASADGASAASSGGGIVPGVKLGAAYNLFDAEELLEYSVRSLRPLAEYVVVVYQKESNFGNVWNPRVQLVLDALVAKGLVDELVCFTPRTYSDKEKKALVSPRATGADLGCSSPTLIGDQFFNELSKREIGRRKCIEAGCSHFMSLDVDECYHKSELEYALKVMVENNYECALCNMRYYFKHPQWELLPQDNLNFVPAIYKCVEEYDFRVGCPYPFLIDPTRKLNALTRLKVFKRSELEMHHYALVRNDVARKVLNTSNRGNYSALTEFVAAFAAWKPGNKPVHPHPYFAELFKRSAVVDNPFGIQVREDAASGIVTVVSELGISESALAGAGHAGASGGGGGGASARRRKKKGKKR